MDKLLGSEGEGIEEKSQIIYICEYIEYDTRNMFLCCVTKRER